MTQRKLLVVILAAGKGTRMHSNLPKVLHPLAGRPMIQYLINTVEGIDPERVVVIVGPEMEDVTRAVAPHRTLVQSRRLGTGHAVAVARELLHEFNGEILLLCGDVPLLPRTALTRMLSAMRAADLQTCLVVLGFYPNDPAGYGRLITASDGSLRAIVEHQDATPSQGAMGLCNSGAMVIRSEYLFHLLDAVGNNNASGEYYLTDIVAVARHSGLRCSYVEVESESVELFGINTQRDLARAEAFMQEHLRGAMLDSGVTLVDPLTVHCCFDTKIGRNVIIHPYVVFGSGVTIGDNVEIQSFCHLEQSTVSAGVRIGPYARLRPGATINANVHIGNFVEIKSSVVETGAKVNHLSYIGDGRVGAGANIGAGTIFCNYNGHVKAFTDVGAGAFIGSNSALVAPVKIGDNAIIGAGSVITKNVAANALAVARCLQKERPGWASLRHLHHERGTGKAAQKRRTK